MSLSNVVSVKGLRVAGPIIRPRAREVDSDVRSPYVGNSTIVKVRAFPLHQEVGRVNEGPARDRRVVPPSSA